MTNSVTRRPGFTVPKNSNITGIVPPRIAGPYTTPASDTVYTCMFVTVNASNVLAACAAKSKPFGVVQTRSDYAWGTTTPGNYILLPQGIDVYVIVFGSCLVAMDASQVPVTTYAGATVFATLTAGLACCSLLLVSGEAGDHACGSLLDSRAGNDGSDGDLMEIIFNPSNTVVSTS
jgi:hypothetical protein